MNEPINNKSFFGLKLTFNEVEIILKEKFKEIKRAEEWGNVYSYIIGADIFNDSVTFSLTIENGKIVKVLMENSEFGKSGGVIYEGGDDEKQLRDFDLLYNIFKNVIKEIEKLFLIEKFSPIPYCQKIDRFHKDLKEYFSDMNNAFVLAKTPFSNFIECKISFNDTGGENWKIKLEDKFSKGWDSPYLSSPQWVILDSNYSVIDTGKGVKLIQTFHPILYYELVHPRYKKKLPIDDKL